MSLLHVAGISVKENAHFALKNISFSQEEFQNVAVAGETGSGKSTLLKTVAGFIQPDAGEVYFEQTRVKGPAEKLVPGHTGIAYLSQQFELPKSLRVEQVLRYANALPQLEAGNLYEVCRIDHLLMRRTDHLSGGERQRIALARLLSTSPKLLLLDEPYSNLDMVHKNILKSVIEDIGAQLNITCTLISHDPHDTLSWADKILVMKAGELQQFGTPEQIYRQPVNEYTAALFGSYNLLLPYVADSLTEGTAAAFNNGKNLLVRPENFKLDTTAGQGQSGQVSNVKFFGSFYEATIKLNNGITIQAKTRESKAAKGDTVYVSISPENLWYI